MPPVGVYSWTLDPIDGTLGFLRDEQYAVCLARLDSSKKVTFAVMNCPNLSKIDPKSSSNTNIFTATKNGGCYLVCVLGRFAEVVMIFAFLVSAK